MTKQFGTPGPRAIHPELCDSPSLGSCGLLANALFPRLVAMADDQGRLAGDAMSVLVGCMGRLLRIVTLEDVAAALAELEAAELVQRYSDKAGHEYLQLVSWWRWQNGQRRAYPSRWPAPPGWHDLVYGCAAAPGLERFEDAVESSPRRNAAIRGIPRQSAANGGDLPLRTRAPMRAPMRARARAHAVPGTVPDTVPSGARAGASAAPRGGAPTRVGEVSEFQKRVPRPGEVVV